MITSDEEIPPFFHELQELASRHNVLVYATVAVVMRDGKAVIATAGGSKLPDGSEMSERVYESMARAFDTVVERLSSQSRDRGALN